MIPYRKQKRKKRYPHKSAKLRPPQPPGLANVRHMRKLRGWSQVELSQRSGVKTETIVAIEKRITIDPKISTLTKLAQALDVTIGELIGVENPLDK